MFGHASQCDYRLQFRIVDKGGLGGSLFKQVWCCGHMEELENEAKKRGVNCCLRACEVNVDEVEQIWEKVMST